MSCARTLGTIGFVTAFCFGQGDVEAQSVTYRTVALSGTQAPGTTPGTLFRGFGTPWINASGRTAFVAHLIGPDVIDANEAGAWCEDASL